MKNIKKTLKKNSRDYKYQTQVKTCPWCEEQYLTLPYAPLKYCSKKCYSKSMEILPENYYSKYVIKRKGCWGWSGHSTDGYGQFLLKNKNYRIHRFSYTIYVGQIPKNMWVLHKCDNPICSNPKHLYLGTHADNEKDKLTRNRQATGERRTPIN